MKSTFLAALAATLLPFSPAAAQIPYLLKHSVPPPVYPVQTLTKQGSSVAVGTIPLNNQIVDYHVMVGAPYEEVTGLAEAGMVKDYTASNGLARYILQCPTPHAGDRFGSALANDDFLLAVGAPYDDTGAADTGIVYGFIVSGSPPSSTSPWYTMHNPSPDAGDHFGAAVGVYVNPNVLSRIVVGAPQDDTGAADAGRAYVFNPTSGTPDTPIATLSNPSPAAGDQFGSSVDMNGTRVVVGAPFADTGGSDSGVVYVFDLSSGTPTAPIATLANPSPAPNDHFGAAVAIEGDLVIVGAPGDQTGAAGAGSVYVYNLTSGTVTVPVQTLHNPTPAADENFGCAVAISGTRVVVGAAFDNTGATTAGSTYVYDLNGATPTVPVTTLNNPTPQDGDHFGSAVAILDTHVAVGAPNDDVIAADAGSAYFYNVGSGTPTTPVSTLNDPAQSLFDQFGVSVAMSGHLLVVGATGDDSGANDAGRVHVFDLTSATPLVPIFSLRNPAPSGNGNFGNAVALSGTRLVVGAQGYANQSGRAYVYDLAGLTPGTPQYILENPQPGIGDAFGTVVAISGSRVAIGAPNGDVGDLDAGSVHIYDLAGATPATPVLNLANPGQFGGFGAFGGSLALSGNRLVVGDNGDNTGANSAGRAFLYDLAGATPSVPLILTDPTPVLSNDQFGVSVSISGSLVVVGARGKNVGASDSGSAYVYDLAGATPTTPIRTLNHPFPAAADQFGTNVAISGTRAVITTPVRDLPGAVNAGCVYIYELSSATPTVPAATINNPAPIANNFFGAPIAIESDVVAIGADFVNSFGLGDGTAYVFVPGRVFTQKILAVAAPKGKGSTVTGEPAGTTFTTIGGPATDGRGRATAFSATLRDTAGKTVKALFADGIGVIARVKQTAPGAGTATFKSFGDPLVSKPGVAFSAKLSDGRSGIWTTAFGHGLEAVLLTGEEAPGLPGSKIASLTTFSLRGEEIVALLKLKIGPGGITAAKDTVLVRSGPTTDTLLLQESDPLTADGVASPIKKFSVFTPAKLAPGQDRSHAEGAVALNVTLADGRFVALAIDSTGGRHVVAYNRSADGVLKIYSLFGLPCAGALDAVVLKGFPIGALKSADEYTLVEKPGQESPDLPSDLAEGFAAPGGGGALFGVMSDPLINDEKIHAFLAKLTGPKALKLTAKNNTGLYWGHEGSIARAARLDDFAPDKDGQATTAKFAAFKLFGLPDGEDAGPVFTAKLTGAKGSGVTGKNNQGLYAIDSTGHLREVLRTDQPLTFGNATLKVKSFTALTGGVPVGGRRAFTTAGVFTARVVLSDKSTAIVRLEIP